MVNEGVSRGALLVEVASTFTRLGCTSFGGPVAHLGYLRAETVEKRRWLDDAHFGDLVALCQFLPGPASSQLVFALGMKRAGLAGACLASLCFTLPSAVIMVAFAYGLTSLGTLADAGWLHGLKLCAVPVVAQAVWAMGRKLCTDRARVTLALGTAAVLLAWPGPWMQVLLIALGSAAGLVLYGRDGKSQPDAARVAAPTTGHAWAAAALVLFFVLLGVLPVMAAMDDHVALRVVDAFYRSGSLVFGGGHVVLPLLRSMVVPTGWITDDAFLAGYGVAQSVPGPLFTFAAYVGAAIQPAFAPAWAQGLLALLAIFLPAWLLIGGALPSWERMRSQPAAQAALSGANATVVGVLLAALYVPVMAESLTRPLDVPLALVAFALLESWKVPSWAVVLGLAAVSQALM